MKWIPESQNPGIGYRSAAEKWFEGMSNKTFLKFLPLDDFSKFCSTFDMLHYENLLNMENFGKK